MRSHKRRAWLFGSMIVWIASTLSAATPPPAAPAAPTPPAASPVVPLPSYPNLTSDFTSTLVLQPVRQEFSGKLKRLGRQIYLEEESSSSGPISYNEYYIYDFEKNLLYRILRDERVYFETPLTIDQQVDAIRKGWVPAEGTFTFNNIIVKLSSRDILLRPDTIDNRPVNLLLREITAEIPAVGTTPTRSVKSYSFVWLDPALALPVKISYSANSAHTIVTYRNIELESAETNLFTIPKDYPNLSPY
jgi:hypothetical protein